MRRNRKTNSYHTYPQTAALSQTTLTTTLATNVAAAPPPQLSIAHQPAAGHSPSGVTAAAPFRPTLPIQLTGSTVLASTAVAANAHRPAALPGPHFHSNRGVFQSKRGQGFRGGVLNKPTYRPGFKRKLEEPKEDSESLDPLSDLMQPLFCKLCKVVLNAPAQAKQHYEGKNHLRKVKMFMEGKEDDEAAQDSQVSSTTNGQPLSPGSTATGSPSCTVTPDPIDPEIYCKTCGVSFNSTKQAQQHYQGKNHAKRVRATQETHSGSRRAGGTALHNMYKKGSRYCCEICNVTVSNKEQLDSHYQGVKHAAQVKLLDKASKALKGRWGTTGGKITGGGFSSPSVHYGSHSSSSHFRGNHQKPGGQPAAKKPRGDFSNYRLPSGKFYCSMCSVNVGTESAIAGHVDSMKHRSNIAAKKTEELAEKVAGT